jgi:hypothetical protein
MRAWRRLVFAIFGRLVWWLSLSKSSGQAKNPNFDKLSYRIARIVVGSLLLWPFYVESWATAAPIKALSIEN